ncbi:MAG: DUF5916 domain-containing protein [Longimicrobiales bacterium]
MRGDTLQILAAALLVPALLVPALAGTASAATPDPQSPQSGTAAHGTNGTNGTGSDGGVPTVTAERIEAPPQIDGRLDDAAWADAAVATGFIQMRPDPGAAASFPTEVRVLYDDEAVYVGMRLRDPEPSEIAAQLGRRDASGIYSDWAHVMIDSYHDRRTAFRFSVNPTGVQKDVLHYDDHSEDVNWDGVWEAAASVGDEGWVAEFRIPLSQLRFSAAEACGSSAAAGCGEVVWGVNFGREIARLNQWAWWAPVLPDVAGFVSAAGELRGIRELEPPRRLEALPYVVAQGSRVPVNGSPFQSPDGRDSQLHFGADLEYGITSDLTLSATINPDFGQVEADPSVVNLTAQETFYPERRPFFVEGSNIFGFNIGFNDNSGEGLFYTRRIGRSPQRGLSDFGDHTDSPGTTTILGAGKLSGRTAGGWSVGLLHATTAEETGRVLTGTDGIQPYVVEPLTNYSVLRASRDFRDGRSAAGVMATGTHRRLNGTPGLAFLTDRAYAGGLDFRHRFADDSWDLSGWFAGSYVTGDSAAIQRLQTSSLRYYQRPEADHVEYDPAATSLAGYGGTLNLWKVAGSWRGGVGGTFRSPGLELNDAGFQTAADLAIVYANLRYHRFDPIGPFRSFTIGVNPSTAWDFGGLNLHKQLNLFANTELTNNWSFGFWSGRAFPGVSNGALRGGPAIRRPGALRANVWMNTDSRKPVRVNLNGGWSVDDQGAGWSRRAGASVTWRPSGRLDLSLGPSINERSSEWQYITQTADHTGDTHYIFAPIHQRTFSLTTRVSYAFTPTLSLQLYAQPFVSAGRYAGFREVADPQADRFGQRFHTFSDQELSYVPDGDGGWGTYAVDTDGDGTADYSFNEPDFSFKELRSNAVLRWEYRPGSTLFVVWSQGRSRVDPTGQFHVIDDFDRLVGTGGSSVLAVKLNYWLDF